jgi:hypothetical protein
MEERPDRFGLTAVLLVLSALQAVWGRADPGLYRDAPEIALTWVGNDWVTLLVALPVIAVAALGARGGGRAARLVWMGGLAFLVYNYAFYMIGTALNAAFPLYVALVLGAGVALARALLRTDPPPARGGAVPRAVGLYLLAVAATLTLVWALLWRSIVFGGMQGGLGPDAFQVVAALDMTLLVPGFVMGGVLILRGHRWGETVAAIASVQGALYLLVLGTNAGLFVIAGYEAPPGQLAIWVPLCAMTAVAATLLLRRA